MFEAALSEAGRTNPQLLNSAFFFAYGAAAEQAGQLDLAEQLLKRSIELDRSNAAQALNYLGYAWVDRNIRIDEAGGLIRKALEMEPDNPAFLDSLGWFHFRKGEYPEALRLLMRAAETIHPEDAVIYEHIGDVQSALGDTRAALEFWRKALHLDPGNAPLAEKIRKAESP
jgi:tetratricopeptide (TPR) repeat protein